MSEHIKQIEHGTTALDTVIVVRRVRTLDEYRQCERLQERIWGLDGVARVPLLDLLTAQENGGLVLGAFDRDTLVGFVYSILGMGPHGRLKHCSVVLCVAGEHRGNGHGLRLKLAQRDEVLAQEIDLVTWTFDPLLAVNAGLNIGRLGGVCREYRTNHYDTGRGLYAGLDTDRLIVEWWLRRERRQPVNGGRHRPVPVAAVTSAGRNGLPRIASIDPAVDAEAVLLPIPPDIEAIIRQDRGLAGHWRQQTRALFRTYFWRGYRAVEFHRDPGRSRLGCPAYLLTREAHR